MPDADIAGPDRKRGRDLVGVGGDGSPRQADEFHAAGRARGGQQQHQLVVRRSLVAGFAPVQPQRVRRARLGAVCLRQSVPRFAQDEFRPVGLERARERRRCGVAAEQHHRMARGGAGEDGGRHRRAVGAGDEDEGFPARRIERPGEPEAGRPERRAREPPFHRGIDERGRVFNLGKERQESAAFGIDRRCRQSTSPPSTPMTWPVT